MGGAGTSGIGDGLVEVALPLLLATRGGSALLVTSIAAVQGAPWLLLGLQAGAAVDRYPLARLLARIDLIRAAVIGLLVIAITTDTAVIPAAFVAAATIGAGDALVTAGLDAATVRLLPDDQLERGNGRMFTTMTVTQHLLGPALGGVLFRVSTLLPFAIDAITYIGSAQLFRTSAPDSPATSPDPATNTTMRHDIRLGLRWFAQHPTMRRLTGILLAFSATHAAVMAAIVLLVLRRYDATEIALGVVLVAAAIGNTIGAAISERVFARLALRTVLMGGGTIVGAGYLLLGTTTSVATAGAAMAVIGTVIGTANVGLAAARQRIIPLDMVGRATSIVRMAAWGSAPVAAIAVGAAATAIGTGPAVVAVGIIQLTASTILPLRLTNQALRPARTPPDATPQPRPDTTDQHPGVTVD
ncbi:Antibiotic efflux protein (plasmid) [Euzebya pacifica]|uniref:Antibiotic efflux protein n=1 Tax=Euzebya pacifica TaxID=1608957 RepID=A0A346Y6I7_9ACTN|nr:Antibiotic efflux protein [Euzebya pacifica]